MPIQRYEGRRGRPYVPVVRAGCFVFTAGYTGFRPDGSIPESIDEQVAIIFDRARTNLEKAGSSFDRIVSATIYFTDQARDRKRFDELFGAAFAGHPPARCCISVVGLSDPAKRVEIQFIAMVKEED